MATKQETINELKAKGIPYNPDASYNELRSTLAKHKTEIPPQDEPVDEAENRPMPEPPTISEVDTALSQAEQIEQADKDAEIAKLKEENAKLKEPKGIPSKAGDNVRRNADGTVMRDDEQMRETFEEAVTKAPEDLDDADRVSIEREIRRYVKRGGVKKDQRTGHIIVDPATNVPVQIKGGFKKGITETQKKRTKAFILRMNDGRDPDNPTWNEDIRVPGFVGSE